MPLPLDDGPGGAIGAGDSEAVEDLGDLARATGVAEGDAVSWAPVADCGRRLRCGALRAEMVAKGRGLAGNRQGLRENGGRRRGVGGDAQLARGALGEEGAGEGKALAAVAFCGETAKRFGGVVAERDAERVGGVAKQAALQGWRERGDANDVERDGFLIGGGAASATDRASREDQLRGDPGQFGLPECFFVARQRGHVGQVGANLRIPSLKFREQLVADSVACEGRVAVGGVFAPSLAEAGQVRFDFGTCDGQHGAENEPIGKSDDRMDAGEAFGPGAAEEFAEDGFGLIVQGVGGGDGVQTTRGQELSEPGVAQAASGFFDGFALLAGFRSGIDVAGVELETQRRGEFSGEILVGVRVGSAQPVMEMGGVEDEAEFAGARREGACEGDGIGAAGEANGETQAGADERGIQIKNECGGYEGHRMMVDQCILGWLCRYLRYFPPPDWGRAWQRPSPSSFLS